MAPQFRPVLKHELARLEDPKSRYTALISLQGHIKRLDHASLRNFLDSICELKDQGATRPYIISLYEDVAVVHRKTVIPYISRIMASIIRTLASSGSDFQLHRRCGNVVAAIGNRCIDPQMTRQQVGTILRYLSKPLLEALVSSFEPMTGGAAFCLKSLVELNSWSNIPQDILDELYIRLTFALSGRVTVNHMELACALAKSNSQMLDTHALEWLDSCIVVLRNKMEWQLRAAAAQLMGTILSMTERRNLMPSIDVVVRNLDASRLDKMPKVRKEVADALQIARNILKAGDKQYDNGIPMERNKPFYSTFLKSQSTGSLLTKSNSRLKYFNALRDCRKHFSNISKPPPSAISELTALEELAAKICQERPPRHGDQNTLQTLPRKGFVSLKNLNIPGICANSECQISEPTRLHELQDNLLEQTGADSDEEGSWVSASSSNTISFINDTLGNEDVDQFSQAFGDANDAVDLVDNESENESTVVTERFLADGLCNMDNNERELADICLPKGISIRVKPTKICLQSGAAKDSSHEAHIGTPKILDNNWDSEGCQLSLIISHENTRNALDYLDHQNDCVAAGHNAYLPTTNNMEEMALVVSKVEDQDEVLHWNSSISHQSLQEKSLQEQEEWHQDQSLLLLESPHGPLNRMLQLNFLQRDDFSSKSFCIKLKKSNYATIGIDCDVSGWSTWRNPIKEHHERENNVKSQLISYGTRAAENLCSSTFKYAYQEKLSIGGPKMCSHDAFGKFTEIMSEDDDDQDADEDEHEHEHEDATVFQKNIAKTLHGDSDDLAGAVQIKSINLIDPSAVLFVEKLLESTDWIEIHEREVLDPIENERNWIELHEHENLSPCEPKIDQIELYEHESIGLSEQKENIVLGWEHEQYLNTLYIVVGKFCRVLYCGLEGFIGGSICALIAVPTAMALVSCMKDQNDYELLIPT